MHSLDATRPETLIQHWGEEEAVKGAVVPPIFQNSLFVFDDYDSFTEAQTWGNSSRHSYSRISNPTLDVVEKKLAELEHCECAKVFSSGMAAISAGIFSCVKAGAHVVCVDSVYGCTRELLTHYLPRFGVTATFVDGRTPESFTDAIKPETTLLYLESPSSAVMRLQDLEAICTAAHQRGISTAMDNSYSTPIFQTPADFGVDIVLHSASKYLGGHSDLVAGVVATSTERMRKLIDGEVALFGGTLAPMQAWLLLRGLRTLPVRMKAHQATANKVAHWLSEQPQVAEVLHVGLSDYPQRELFEKQMRGTGGLFTFFPRRQDGERIKAFVSALKLYRLGVSWGGYESLCLPLQFGGSGLADRNWALRVYCGLEHADDLIADMKQAFEAAGL